MSRTRSFPRLVLAAAVLLVACAPGALALERGGASIEVLVGGRALAEYQARGATYIEAQRGQEYAIRLTNHTSERIAVALSVDGLNTIDARTSAAREGSKWVLAPYQTITLSGWQINSGHARQFFFTTEDRSYGAWLGRTQNLGVIAAAVFRERRPEPRPPYSFHDRYKGEPEAAAGAAPQRGAELRSNAPAKELPRTSDELAATGIGRRVQHPVEEVDFEASGAPPTILEMRYEYHDALVRLGVLPRPDSDEDQALVRREHARGFSDQSFCPDPFRRGRD